MHAFVKPTRDHALQRGRDNVRALRYGGDAVDPYGTLVNVDGCARCEMIESHPCHGEAVAR